VSTAKKGWINRNTVINTWDTEKLLDFLKNRYK
jgi:DNA polymerase (family X)